ncbi:MAG: ATP-binding protein [Deltaproteobacteria bacterium]|nr:ATP-binding protein [Deltaproteobacteria bacterium]
MTDRPKRNVTLKAYADPAFLPLATAFVENAAVGLGLQKSRALSLTLATEEIFSYLCKTSTPENAIEIECTSGGYYVQAAFVFSVEDFNMHAFNLTTTISVDDETSLDEMGLLIASRAVDRFEILEEKEDGLRLLLIKEKDYPPLDRAPAIGARPLEAFTIRDVESEELKIFSLLVNQYYRQKITPDFFKYPGKLVDMVKGGNYKAALAVGKDGHVGGGMVWRFRSDRLVECYGPYLFNQGLNASMGTGLVEKCLEAIARTHAVGLMNQFPTDDLPEDYFEAVGAVHLHSKDGATVFQDIYFRHLQEDPGASLWVHPRLQDFLLKACDELVLPREIQLVTDRGESRSRFSVLAARFNRAQNRVFLRPMRFGTDFHENIVNYLRLFSRESIRNVFFVMDLAVFWQAHFTPALLDNGFEPQLVLPYGGKGDLVVFQLKGPQQ